MYRLLILFLVSLPLVNCERSFTIVVDTTISMEYELEVLKSNIGSVVTSISSNTDIRNYILVPFNDTIVGPIIESATPEGLHTHINLLHHSGGSDCPEDSVNAIKIALERSTPDSYIFVFTDAYARDDSQFYTVQNLCRISRSQVFIFLSGSCVQTRTTQEGNKNVFFDIAKSCSGSVLQFNEMNLRQAFKFMKEVITRNYNDIQTYDPIVGYKQLPFSIDSLTNELMIAVSGDASMEIFPANKFSKTVRIVDSKQSLVMHISKPEAGEYNLNILGADKSVLSFYRKKELPFSIGFSTKCPTSFKETASRPIPGWTNYIGVMPLKSGIRFYSLEWKSEKGTRFLGLDEMKEISLYMTRNFVEPNESFRITIYGFEEATNQNITVSTPVLEPQKIVSGTSWIKPRSNIIEPISLLVNFEMNTTIACKVTSYPQPTIWWEDDSGTKIQSEDGPLEIPHIFISYATIDKVTANSTYYCKSKNDLGEDSQSISIFVNRPFVFDVLQSPSDISIDYENEERLDCRVKAYPEAQIKWYLNDTDLENSDHHEILSEGGLIIKNMSLNEVGTYKCEVTNDYNTRTFTADVTISGLESPEVSVELEEIFLKPGDPAEIPCTIIEGTPSPDITWTYKSNDGIDFEEIPIDMSNDNGILQILSAKLEHKGTYKCTATNFMGEDSKEVTVNIQYAPKIEGDDTTETLTVKEGDPIELKCQVDADPPATVYWDFSQDDNRQRINDQHIHRFNALSKDSGNYHCTAENSLGKAEKTVIVNVLVPPYIQPTEFGNLTLRAGSSISLPCNVLNGNPVPSTIWEFIALDSRKTALSRGNLTHELRLRNISPNQAGSYFCVANNDVGTDSIKINIKVQ